MTPWNGPNKHKLQWNNNSTGYFSFHPTQPNPWMDPTLVHVCGYPTILYARRKKTTLWKSCPVLYSRCPKSRAPLFVISTGWPQKKNWLSFLYALTLSNSDRFSKSFHRNNQEKMCNNIITKDPTIPQVCCYATLLNVAHWVGQTVTAFHCFTDHAIGSGVAGLNASSISNVDTLNIWCKNCRMWQLLYRQ